MPELPEVETTRRGIAPYLEGKIIAGAIVRNPSLRWPIPNRLAEIMTGLTIQKVVRRAKYLLLNCSSGTLIFHLGMSGSLIIQPRGSGGVSESPGKHDHFDLILMDRTILRLRDPRRFGAVLWHPGNVFQHPLLTNLGPEPLTADFNAQWFWKKTRNSLASIKQTLLNGRMVAGMGNIYANEALFLAGINPKIAAGKIGIMRYERLVQAIKQILQRAIQAGGSSLRDFVKSDGNPGYFQQHYAVYGREGQRCMQCSHTIKQFKQNQRSSFFCPNCQR